MLIASFMGDQDAHEVWGPRARIQIFKKKFYTHIHLNLIRIELLSCIKKKICLECGYWFNRYLNFHLSYWSLHGALDMGLLVLFVFQAHHKVLQWAHYQYEMTTLRSDPHLLVIYLLFFDNISSLYHVLDPSSYVSAWSI